jgi:3-oxoacyl-[acyl-carrier-protein] synthase-1
LQPLALTASSLVTCLGVGRAENVAALRARRTGLAPCAFETVSLDTYVGEVRGVDEVRIPDRLRDYNCRNNRMAQLGLDTDGLSNAVLAARERYGRDRIGVFLGTSTSGILETELAYRRRDADGKLPADFRYREAHNTYSLADYVRHVFELSGPAVVVSAACASSAKVFGNAARAIAAGLCDAALVGGVDSLCLTTLYGFHSLNLLSSQPCRPFDAARDGISLSEGAGFVLLEKPQRAGTPGRVHLLGVGDSSDAHHMSTPHPEGAGARMAMERALAAAGVAPERVDYINLHGTASRSNDSSEDAGVMAAFGAATPCSSTKGLTGHALGAAGAIEAIITAIALEEGFLPAGVNTQARDPALHADYLLAPRAGAPRIAMSNSFGFGGANCALLLGLVA